MSKEDVLYGKMGAHTLDRRCPLSDNPKAFSSAGEAFRAAEAYQNSNPTWAIFNVCPSQAPAGWVVEVTDYTTDSFLGWLENT